MTLAALIRGQAPRSAGATATGATLATELGRPAGSVATVASVAVANPAAPETGAGTLPDRAEGLAKVDLDWPYADVTRPLVLRDGRRMWRLPASHPIPSRSVPPVADLARRLRSLGVVLFADGQTLRVVAPDQLPDADLAALTEHAADVIANLRGESEARIASGTALVATEHPDSR